MHTLEIMFQQHDFMSLIYMSGAAFLIYLLCLAIYRGMQIVIQPRSLESLPC